MKQKFQQLQQDQVTKRLKAVRSVEPPPGGWIRTIRDALGMSASQLARRIGVKQPAVVQWEEGERKGTISLLTLRKVAAALECDLVGALVPRKPLKKILQDRAQVLATRTVEQVSHSMDLEDQRTSAARHRKAIRDETRRLLEDSPRRLWDE